MTRSLFARGFALLGLGAMLALGACQTASTGGTTPVVTPTPSTGTTVLDQAAGIVSEVQAKAAQACKFVPTAKTVSALIGTFTGTSPLVDGGFALADAICAVANRPKVTRYGSARRFGEVHSVGTLDGVPVSGEFVR